MRPLRKRGAWDDGVGCFVVGGLSCRSGSVVPGYLVVSSGVLSANCV